MNQSAAAARWRAAALGAAIVGAAASTYLLVEYVTGQPGVCLTGSGCDLVRASAYAYPLGIPTPLIGLVFYLVCAWLVLRTIDRSSLATVPAPVLLVAAAAAGAVASMVLTGLEAFVIKAFCSWCLVQAAASLVLFGAAVGLARTGIAPPPEGHSSRTRQQAARALDAQRRSLQREARFGGGIAAVLVAGLLAVGAVGGSPSGSPAASSLVEPGSPTLGSGPVQVVEFADFECPGCAALAPILVDLANASVMTLAYRYFPLDSIHSNADASARAAAAAARQGKFWPMAEALFAQQAAWQGLSRSAADAYFATLATGIGLDLATWQADFASSAVEATVNVDRQAATQMGIGGTPALFIGGTLYAGSLDATSIRAAIAAVAPAS
jgi:protein-disulfide isomerase